MDLQMKLGCLKWLMKDYQMKMLKTVILKPQKKLEKMDVTLTSLTNFETVLRHASAMGIIDEEQHAAIENWQRNPAKWEK